MFSFTWPTLTLLCLVAFVSLSEAEAKPEPEKLDNVRKAGKALLAKKTDGYATLRACLNATAPEQHKDTCYKPAKIAMEAALGKDVSDAYIKNEATNVKKDGFVETLKDCKVAGKTPKECLAQAKKGYGGEINTFQMKKIQKDGLMRKLKGEMKACM